MEAEDKEKNKAGFMIENVDESNDDNERSEHD